VRKKLCNTFNETVIFYLAMMCCTYNYLYYR